MSSSAAQLPRLALLYFDIHGLGARIRLAAAVGGVALEDRRFRDRAEFTAMKLGAELPFGQVPLLLLYDDADAAAPPRKLAQSSAILRYVCRRGGLHPADDLEAALVDAALVAESDAFAAVGCAKYRDRNGFASLEGAALEAAERALRCEVVPRHLDNLERALRASATGWVAGTPRPAACDFAWGTNLRDLRAGGHSGFLPAAVLQEAAPDGAPRFAAVNAFVDKFLALPEVAAYYAAHP